ncbi:galactose mutarotase [Neoasaia chiangmaiensis NBRC 101099]|uniref:Aldose epimerase n=1 Tax=Neoasaia chiangmaiensis TaxID=320497 RepID=A0A1U9KQC6_9PROT|nr:aldose 1-epimerase family protein [Neoasaia chiangmaiensis]AQS87930.1 aldose epimerase [Neoasaia chiangmaiensis]GBR39048.1 galactose mutarotase [Neoasaia chiangmaiensis NBRC 101099]GEN15582.1 aldose 1-epimerase [Neoasaia chiangmaiensis]
MGSDRHEFGDGRLTATVTAAGAELVALDVVGDGARSLLWAGVDPWPRHSPVLFPIVGRIPDDRLPWGDREVRLKQHGFARDRVFQWVERTDDGCVLELADDEASRAIFPAAFRLRLNYRVTDGRLHVGYALHNPDGEAVLHASVGAHPAFAWPQEAGAAREAHRLIFDRAEVAPIRRVEGGLMRAEAEPTPVVGRELALSDALFEDDAVIFKPILSDSVRFVGPKGTGIEVGWQGFPELGVWTKVGAAFLCIEPWHGYATPQGFAGDFAAKPGNIHLRPGKTWEASWTVRAVEGD